MIRAFETSDSTPVHTPAESSVSVFTFTVGRTVADSSSDEPLYAGRRYWSGIAPTKRPSESTAGFGACLEHPVYRFASSQPYLVMGEILPTVWVSSSKADGGRV
jgi:hypothetical protein